MQSRRKWTVGARHDDAGRLSGGLAILRSVARAMAHLPLMMLPDAVAISHGCYWTTAFDGPHREISPHSVALYIHRIENRKVAPDVICLIV